MPDIADDKIVKFDDGEREPQVPFHREWPWGKDIDISRGAPSCRVELPWPARRCGLWLVECKTCGLAIALTAAGRVDDPRSLRAACLKVKHDA